MISTSNISMRFGQTTLFEDVSVKFVPGNRYGLIGANGSGKSTFMKILTGQLDQTEGQVSVGHGCTLGYLRQDHSAFDDQSIIDTVYTGNPALWKLHCEREYLYSKDELTDEENDRCSHIEEEFGDAGGYTMESEAARLLIGLGFAEDLFEQKMTVLQGGFKLRVLLAQALFFYLPSCVWTGLNQNAGVDSDNIMDAAGSFQSAPIHPCLDEPYTVGKFS